MTTTTTTTATSEACGGDEKSEDDRPPSSFTEATTAAVGDGNDEVGDDDDGRDGGDDDDDDDDNNSNDTPTRRTGTTTCAAATRVVVAAMGGPSAEATKDVQDARGRGDAEATSAMGRTSGIPARVEEAPELSSEGARDVADESERDEAMRPLDSKAGPQGPSPAIPTPSASAAVSARRPSSSTSLLSTSRRRASAASSSSSAAGSDRTLLSVPSDRGVAPTISSRRAAAARAAALSSSSALTAPSAAFPSANMSNSNSESYRRLQNLTVNKLQFDKLGRLYGRDDQCQRLGAAFRDMMAEWRRRRQRQQQRQASFADLENIGGEGSARGREAASGGAVANDDDDVHHHRPGRRWFVAVTGESGAGKSTLAETLRADVVRAGGFFIQGKFPQPAAASNGEFTAATPGGRASAPPAPAAAEPFAAFAEATADLSDAVAALYSPQLRHGSNPQSGTAAAGATDAATNSNDGSRSPARRGGVSHPPSLSQFRERLGRQVGDDASLIVRVIPESNHLLGPSGPAASRPFTSTSSSSSSSIAYREANHQFKAAFRRFIRAMTSVAPLVLVLDDMQWADAASMELLEALVADRDSSSLMVIGCYRTYVPPPGSVDSADLAAGNANVIIPPHIRTVEAIQRLSNAPDSELQFDLIDVDNLSAVQINDLLMDLLSLPASDTLNLAYCVHKKTLGNIFFVIQYLTLLQESDLLEYNLCALKWSFNLAAIRDSTFATDNVVHLVKSKLERLPSATVRVLPVMACLGSNFALRSFELVVSKIGASQPSPEPPTAPFNGSDARSDSTPSSGLAASSPGSDAVRYLSQCESEGLIEMMHDNEKTWYRWAHDKIQEAALSLLDDDALNSLRVTIGRILWDGFSALELEDNIFLVSTLLSSDRQSAVPSSAESSTKLAALFLRAGCKAVERSAYEIASGYLLSGLSHLTTDCWRIDVGLCLDLFSTAAEVEFCLGKLDDSKSFCNEVITQDYVPFLSKRRAFNVLISCYAAEQRKDDAFGLCRDLLAKLGFKFPTTALPLHVAAGIFRIKSSLKRYTSRETIRQLPALEDERYRWVMTLLDKLSTYAYLTNPILLPLLSFRGLHVTLKVGLCEFAPPIFSSIGFLLTVFVNDFEGGQAFADQAIDLLSHVKNAKKVEARVLFLTHSFIIHWTRPVSLSLKPLRRSFECGMATGDVESACYGICFYVDHAFRTGTPLNELIDDCAYYAESIRESQQMNSLYTMNYLWQTFLFLTGADVYTGEFSGSVLDQETALAEVAKENYNVLFYGIYRLQMYVAFVFGQYEQVYKAMIITGTQRGMYEQVFPGIFGMCHLYTFNGLSLLSLYRETKDKKLLKMAKKFASKVKKWVKKGNPNAIQFDALLDAEFASVRGFKHHAVAVSRFEVAILYSGRIGLTQDRALAHERYGEHLARLGSQFEDDASYHIGQAIRLYGDWGARAKVNLMKRVHRTILGPGSSGLLQMNLEQSFAVPGNRRSRRSETGPRSIA